MHVYIESRMTSKTIRKAIGAVKDQTSIRIAKVAGKGNVWPELEILMVKATSHDGDPSEEKYVREIVGLTSLSPGNADACMAAITKRLGRTRNWVVALKAVMVVHRLLVAGEGLGFQEEILHAKRRGNRIVNLWGFKDEAYSNSWDHCRFVKAYASYLDQVVDLIAYHRRLGFGLTTIGGSTATPAATDTDDEYLCLYSPSLLISNSNPTPKEMRIRRRPERALEKAIQLQRLVDRFLACRPTGEANNNRLVLIGVRLIVKESFKLYDDLREVLDVLLDQFSEMEYKERVMVFKVYVGASKQVVELEEFYGWCKDTGVFPSSSSDVYPRVRRITGILLETLEGSLKERATKKPNPSSSFEEIPHQTVVDANSDDMKSSLPAHQTEKCKLAPSPIPESTPEMMMPQPPKEEAEAEDLVNLRDDDGATGDEHSSQMALTLFSGAPNTSWEALIPSTNGGGEAEVASGWQAPAAAEGGGKVDWELDLVESSRLDQVLLNGIYDEGAVRQEVGSVQLGDGGASCVALPGLGKGAVPVLALPALDGTTTVQAVVGQQDPFAASLTVPPPSYVQIADMERKQQQLVQEQQTWQQYRSNGMGGQVDLRKIGGGFITHYGVASPQAGVVPYGRMPSPAYGMEPHPGEPNPQSRESSSWKLKKRYLRKRCDVQNNNYRSPQKRISLTPDDECGASRAHKSLANQTCPIIYEELSI